MSMPSGVIVFRNKLLPPLPRLRFVLQYIRRRRHPRHQIRLRSNQTMTHRYDEIEHKFGIRAYASTHEGFAAVVKARYSDFIVHEGASRISLSIVQCDDVSVSATGSNQ